MIEHFDLGNLAVDGAFATRNGQSAWKRERLTEVLTDLSRQDYAVISGEVWVVEGNLFSALSPRREGGWAVFSWEVPARLLGEPWDHFATRSIRDTLDAIQELNAENEVAPEVRGKLYYYLCYADEQAYYKLTSVHARDNSTRSKANIRLSM